uniref:MARVEL domain-containing protein n=1 Tax=Heterorhabditis bacteriophora TaxID=37862 RepID=A0A1I7X483_HETBA
MGKDDPWTNLLLYVVSFVLAAAAIFCLFWAMKTENEIFVLPFIAWMGLNILLALIFFVASIWSLIDPQSGAAHVINNIMADGNSTIIAENELEENRTKIQQFSTFVIVIALVVIALAIWFASVAYKYYTYLKAMKKARNPRNVVHHEIDTFKKEIKQ